LVGAELVLDLRIEEGEPSTCEEPHPVQAACPLPSTHETNQDNSRYPTAIFQLPRNAQVPVRIGDEIVTTLPTDRVGLVAPDICTRPFPAARL
jgi:hypothetical protein